MSSEVEANVKLDAQRIAALVGAERVGAVLSSTAPLATSALQRYVFRTFPHTEDGRVIVISPEGTLLADSLGTGSLGTQYATALRPELRRVLRTQTTTAERRHSDTLGQDILVAAAPILDENAFFGAIRLTRGIGSIQSSVRRVVVGLVVVGLGALLAGLLLAFVLAGSFSRPLTRLARVARGLGEGDLSVRAGPTSGASEIAELSRSFDDMAARLEATVKAQREFVANASHQLRTPLTGMKLRLESAIEATRDPDLRRQLEAADREVDRLAEIVERLLVMAKRVEEGGPAEVDLQDAAVRAVDRWRDRASGRAATLTATGSDGRALAERSEVDQIFDNLIDNAIAYAPGEIEIETGTENGRAFIAVRDRGPGIASEDRAHVTERFYRGKGAAAGGSGLGLAIVRELAERWGGEVSIESPETGGTRVRVGLDAPSGSSAPTP